MGGPVGFRAISVVLLLVLLSLMAGANFIPKEDRVASNFWPDNGLRLGLDLRGGIHWVVGVEIEEAITHELEVIRKNLVARLEEQDGVTLAESFVEAQDLCCDSGTRLIVPWSSSASTRRDSSRVPGRPASSFASR